MEPMYVSSHAPHGKEAALNTEPPFLLFCSVPKRLLAEPLLAICATERGARRTDEVIACRIGLPVAAAIAVAVVVVVAIIIAIVATIEGTERSGRDRARRCDGDVALALGVGHLFAPRTLCHGTLGHRWARQRGGEDGGGAEDRK